MRRSPQPPDTPRQAWGTPICQANRSHSYCREIRVDSMRFLQARTRPGRPEARNPQTVAAAVRSRN